MQTPLRLLVVDDENDMCLLLQKTLTRPNERQVDYANSAVEATVKLDRQEYALVLADYSLGPGQSGLDILFAAKARYPRCITILMTGYDTDQLAIRAVAEGVYDYLTKPFENLLAVKNTVDRGIRYYSLLLQYHEKCADELAQQELLAQTLEKARRTQELLTILVEKLRLGNDPTQKKE